jgi:hypothetical protein
VSWTTRGRREFPPIYLELLQSDETGDWAIRVLRATSGGVWEGVAMIPRAMTDEAFIRFSILHVEHDVVDLLREWADDGVVDQYQQIMALES